MSIRATSFDVPSASLAPPLAKFDQARRSHAVQFYADDAFLLAELSRFIGSALGAGDPAIVVATKAHREALGERLKARGLDLRNATQQGRYVALDAAQTLSKFMRDGEPDPGLFAETIGTCIAAARTAAQTEVSRVVVFGEMVALLWADSQVRAAIRLEELWNDLGNTHAFTLRCAYPITGFSREHHSEPFLKICAAHSVVIPGEHYTTLASEEERLRHITHLQQKAQALENEMAERKLAEQALQRANDELEIRVQQRTLELEQKNLQIMQQTETLERTNQGLRELSARLLRVQDEERRRIARDLHDSTGQLLALLNMNLAALEAEARKVSPQLAKMAIDNTRLSGQVSTDLRTLSYLLHPPLLDEIGLESALRWLIDGFAERSGIGVSLEVSPDFERLPRELELAIFRVAQECLTNIHRHSNSPSATIHLGQSSGVLTLDVADQGSGIAPEKLAALASSAAVGVGLRGMKERIKDFHGELTITSLQQGTHIRVVVPLPPAR